jgi:nucleotidyltransferase/DNA polymerase involved in DNA repair
MVRSLFPGDNTKKLVKLAHEGNPPYKERFPRQYEAFSKQQEQVQDGTPIEHWPPLNKAQALELKAMNIHTVEMLAGTSDVNLKWMGARQLRENARAWLSEAENGAEVIKLRNQLEELKLQIEGMQNQNSGFSASKKQDTVIQSNDAAPESEAIKPIVTKMRGRPKKVEDGADIPTVNAASGE